MARTKGAKDKKPRKRRVSKKQDSLMKAVSMVNRRLTHYLKKAQLFVADDDFDIEAVKGEDTKHIQKLLQDHYNRVSSNPINREEYVKSVVKGLGDYGVTLEHGMVVVPESTKNKYSDKEKATLAQKLLDLIPKWSEASKEALERVEKSGYSGTKLPFLKEYYANKEIQAKSEFLKKFEESMSLYYLSVEQAKKFDSYLQTKYKLKALIKQVDDLLKEPGSQYHYHGMDVKENAYFPLMDKLDKAIDIMVKIKEKMDKLK